MGGCFASMESTAVCVQCLGSTRNVWLWKCMNVRARMRPTRGEKNCLIRPFSCIFYLSRCQCISPMHVSVDLFSDGFIPSLALPCITPYRTLSHRCTSASFSVPKHRTGLWLIFASLPIFAGRMVALPTVSDKNPRCLSSGSVPPTPYSHQRVRGESEAPRP